MDKFAVFMLVIMIAGFLVVSNADDGGGSFMDDVGGYFNMFSLFPEAQAATTPRLRSLRRFNKGFSAAQANRLTNGGRRKAPATKRVRKPPTSTMRPEDDLSFLEKPADQDTLKQKERVHKHTRWEESLDYEYARNKDRMEQQTYLEKFLPTETYK